MGYLFLKAMPGSENPTNKKDPRNELVDKVTSTFQKRLNFRKYPYKSRQMRDKQTMNEVINNGPA